MEFLVLAVSYKFDGLCIAGIDFNTKEYVRIVHSIDGESYSIDNNEIFIKDDVIAICDVVDVDVEKLPKDGCHSEDYNLLHINKIVKTVELSEIDDIYSKMEHKNYIFKNNYYKLKPSDGNTYGKSLIFCKVSKFTIEYVLSSKGKPKAVANFIYNNMYYSNMTVTDMVACGYPFGTKKKIVNDANAYIMVSLPNDGWAKDYGYFKYVSGIILIDKEYSNYESD